MVDLGLTIDNNLNWGLHIDRQIAKCTRVLNFLRRNLPFGISIQRKKQLYQSCIISILLYASPCWCASIEGLRKLEKFNSRAMKWVFRSNDYVSSLVSLKLLPICFQVQRIDILLLWKIINMRVIIPHDFTYKSSCTRSGTLKLFELKHNHKFKTNDGFFPRSKRASNDIKVCHPPRKAGTIKWWATTPKVQVPARWHRTHNFWCRTLMYLFVRYNRQLLIPHTFCLLTGTCRGAIYTRCWTISTINCNCIYINQVWS